MSTGNSHLSIPLDLPIREAQERDRALHTLDRLLAAVGKKIEVNDKTYSLDVFATAAEAQQQLGQADDQWKADAVARHNEGDHPLWLTITSEADPTRPAMLIRETFQLPEFIQILSERLADPVHAELVQDFLNVPSRTFTITEFLQDLVLHEVKDDMASNMSSLPYTERIDLGDRDRYLKEPFGVDPVATIQRGEEHRNALLLAADEANLDFIAEQEHGAIEEAMKEWSSKSEDLLPTLELLGVSEDEAEESLRDWAREITGFSGVVDLDLQGNCAISALPFNGNGPIYINFDGVTSSCMNAVIDEDYMAMLDMLRMDVRNWVDFLMDRNGLGPANWKLDLKGIVDALRPQMTPGIFGYETGGAHEISKQLAREIKSQLFNLDPLYEEVTDTAAQDYLYGLAKEVLKAQAADLDKEWELANGIVESQLVVVTSSRENPNLERFPQLAQHPQYQSWISSADHFLSEAPLSDYEWKNPPHKTSPLPCLIRNSRLASVLENCNYSGNVVVSFEADLDDLQEIADGLYSDTGKVVSVRNAYFHIHDYSNGAGDCEPMDSTWSFHTDDIKGKRLRLENDSCDSYGIQSVYGQFLAEGSSVVVQDNNATAPVQRAAEADNSTPTP